MKPFRIVLPLAIAVLSAPTFAADAEAGLAAVKTLGGVNGEALACAETKVAARAKELMLAHAPKTQRFGTAYEEATQEAFLAQTRSGGACPDAIRLTDTLNRLALQLAETLPVVAPAAK